MSGVCDNCGQSFDRGGYYVEEYQLQALPAGETIDGRSWIAVCANGECLEDYDDRVRRAEERSRATGEDF